MIEIKLMVCIADYKLSHRNYLWVLFYEFNKMYPSYKVDIYVNLTDPLLIPEMGDYLPPFDNVRIFEFYHDESIGYDLTFYHRQLMIDKQDDYDLFLYTENDVLYTKDNIDAFVGESNILPDDYIPGFMYYEKKPKPDNNKYLISFSSDWHPQGICNGISGRGGEQRLIINEKSYGTVYNVCQGSYLLTRKQLKKVISYGSYHVTPHGHWDGPQPYGVPETAAAIPYSSSGMKKVIPLDRLDSFLIPHLRNYYVFYLNGANYSDADFLNHYNLLNPIIIGDTVMIS